MSRARGRSHAKREGKGKPTPTRRERERARRARLSPGSEIANRFAKALANRQEMTISTEVKKSLLADSPKSGYRSVSQHNSKAISLIDRIGNGSTDITDNKEVA